MTLRSMMESLALAGALFAVCSYARAQGIPCAYEIAHIIQAPDGPISESPTYATAISPNGRYVVGRFNFDAVGQDRAFVFDTTTQVFQALPLPGGSTNSWATDVTDDGVIVGHVGGSSGNDFGFIYPLSTGHYTLLPPLWVRGGVCWVTGINASGTVCGYRTIAGAPEYPSNAFTWSAQDGFMDLGLVNGLNTSSTDINGIGLVSIDTGFSIDPGVFAYLWLNGSLQRVGAIPGGLSSGAGHLNDHGWMTTGGVVQVNPLVLRTYLRFDDGMFIELPTLPGGFSAALLAITESGVVAGHTNFNVPNIVRRATIWRNAMPTDLNMLLSAPFTGVLESARIGDNETIVANGRNSEGDLAAFLLAPARSTAGDVNCDGTVNIDDLLDTISAWGLCAGCNADLTRDGAVNIFDLLEVILNWAGSGGAT